MDLDFIIKNIRKKIESQREETTVSFSGVPSREEFETLKQKISKKFSVQDLAQILRGRVRFNSRGKFYFIFQEYEFNFKKPAYNFCKEKLLSVLSFVGGIREITENRLRQRGFRELKDLIFHPRFSEKALKICQIIEQTRLNEIISICESRFPKTDSIYLLLSGLCSLEEFLFLDLETLGLFSGNIIFLIGLAKLEPQGIKIFQYLARSPQEESAILEGALKLLNKGKILVSYNGKSFDLPFLEHRVFFSRLYLKKPLLHLDLLHFVRRNFKSLMERFKLSDVESQVFKKERALDIPSEYVPLFYKEYLKSREEFYLLPIIVHNRNDIITLIELLDFFYQKLCQ